MLFVCFRTLFLKCHLHIITSNTSTRQYHPLTCSCRRWTTQTPLEARNTQYLVQHPAPLSASYHMWASDGLTVFLQSFFFFYVSQAQSTECKFMHAMCTADQRVTNDRPFLSVCFVRAGRKMTIMCLGK